MGALVVSHGQQSRRFATPALHAENTMQNPHGNEGSGHRLRREPELDHGHGVQSVERRHQLRKARQRRNGQNYDLERQLGRLYSDRSTPSGK